MEKETVIAKHLRELADKIEKGTLSNVNATIQRFTDQDTAATEAANDGAWRFTVSPHHVLLLTYSEVGAPSATKVATSPGRLAILPESETR